MVPLKQITQETFDSAVLENVIDLEMSEEEAMQDAIELFNSQNVDLTNIITMLTIEVGQVVHKVLKSLTTLSEQLALPSPDIAVIVELLDTIRSECTIDMAHRWLAGKHNAFNIIIQSVKSLENNNNLIVALKSLNALTAGQPDLLTEESHDYLLALLRKNLKENEKVAIELLKFMNNICLKHENNRQMCFKKDVPKTVFEVLESYKESDLLVQYCCSVVKVLTFDDDIRVPFGKAHEHAKLLVTDYNGIERLTALLADHCSKPSTSTHILGALSRLIVRNEFCEEAVKINSQQLTLKVLTEHMDDPAVTKTAFGYLKTLAGNDGVRLKLVSDGVVPVVMSAISINEGAPKVVEAGLACLAACSLRAPDNCKVIVGAGAPALICRVMQLHPTEFEVQKQACLTVRNLVSRTRELCDVFLETGVEGLIHKAYTNFPKLEYDARSALRDLGCEVQLREAWTGKGTEISQE